MPTIAEGTRMFWNYSSPIKHHRLSSIRVNGLIVIVYARRFNRREQKYEYMTT
jgi:hypothetical protein